MSLSSIEEIQKYYKLVLSPWIDAEMRKGKSFIDVYYPITEDVPTFLKYPEIRNRTLIQFLSENRRLEILLKEKGFKVVVDRYKNTNIAWKVKISW